MTSLLEQPHPHHASHLSLAVAGVVLVLTVAFHLFELIDYPYGIPFAVFIVLLVIGMHVVNALTGRQGNSWAYIFLLPALMAAVAEVLFAGNAIKGLGLIISVLSLSLFAYWLTMPRIPYREVKNFLPGEIFLEVFFPVNGSGMFEKWSAGRHTRQIAIGAGVAIPFLLVIGFSFAAADPLFRKSFGDLLSLDFVVRLFIDVILAIYLSFAGWAMLTRNLENRQSSQSEWKPAWGHISIVTFLTLINVLFAIFLAFQVVYFFGGHDYVLKQGLVYAEYARQGFFQLLFVAGLVAVITWGIYRATALRDWASRWLTLILIVQTWVVIASAIRRLMLYIDAYGLTVSRWWAMAVITLIAAVLLIAFVGALLKKEFAFAFKSSLILALYVFSSLLLVNVESQVANYNVQQLLTGKLTHFDADYHIRYMSTDAIPALVTLVQSNWPDISYAPYFIYRNEKLLCETATDYSVDKNCQKTVLIYDLKERLRNLQDQLDTNWRGLVWSDYRAMQVLEKLN